MKYFIIFFLLYSSIEAKECYTNSYLDKEVCYYKYYDRNDIYNPQSDEEYYRTQNGSIYAISDKIEVKFHAIGAILTIIDDFAVDFDATDEGEIGDFDIGFNQYDLEFHDKTRTGKYIFRVKKPDAIFIILRKLNNLENIKSAEPITKRKFSKTEIQRQRELAQQRKSKANQRAGSRESQSSSSSTSPSKAFEGGNFLKGGK